MNGYTSKGSNFFIFGFPSQWRSTLKESICSLRKNSFLQELTSDFGRPLSSREENGKSEQLLTSWICVMQLKKERICSRWSKFFPLRSVPFLEGFINQSKKWEVTTIVPLFGLLNATLPRKQLCHPDFTSLQTGNQVLKERICSLTSFL